MSEPQSLRECLFVLDGWAMVKRSNVVLRPTSVFHTRWLGVCSNVNMHLCAQTSTSGGLSLTRCMERTAPMMDVKSSQRS